jgi:hypothetical protein
MIVAQPAMARPITVQFGGVVTYADAALGGQFPVGSPFAGFYTFESTTADTSDLDTLGRYPAITMAGLAVRRLSAGEVYTTLASGGQIDVFDQPTLDSYNAYVLSGFDGPPVAGLALDRFQLHLNDTSAEVFASDALPARVGLRRFDSRVFVIEFEGEQLVLGEIGYHVRVRTPAGLFDERR